jgi:dTDP-4-dehydrorhamnose 3,5-epimerase-like enzyme
MTLYYPQPDLELAPDIYRTAIPGLYYLNSTRVIDERGYFSQVALLPDLEPFLDSPFTIKQINQARSNQHVARGFHAEMWRKLVWVARGTAFCALADIRPESSAFKQVETFMLGESDTALTGTLFIDRGIANSVCVVNGPIDYLYCVDALYRDRHTENDQAISLFDPDLNVAWPIPHDQMIISNRDQQAITLQAKFA